MFDRIGDKAPNDYHANETMRVRGSSENSSPSPHFHSFSQQAH